MRHTETPFVDLDYELFRLDLPFSSRHFPSPFASTGYLEHMNVFS